MLIEKPRSCHQEVMAVVIKWSPPCTNLVGRRGAVPAIACEGRTRLVAELRAMENRILLYFLQAATAINLHSVDIMEKSLVLIATSDI